jgi:hypothetical protein
LKPRLLVPLLLILLLAFALRVHRLTEIPPGLTHDEANHGWDSQNILDGRLLFYFPLNYGSEPLYNYVVAGSMALLGENVLALRIVNVFAGVMAAAAVYAWARRAFGYSEAVIATGLIAVSFWPLATSRQALRAGLLPLLMVAAVICFWQLYAWAASARASGRPRAVPLAGFALFVAATVHAYLAARVLWLLFPAFLVYLAVFHRPAFRRLWRPALVGLAAAGLLIVPMFRYLSAHPEAETRLEMLDRPLQNLLAGDFGPLIGNAAEALLALVWPGYGDHFVAYNIPGRPALDAVTAAFLVVGLVAAAARFRRPAHAFLLLWLGVGLLPSLVTGAEANTTRNLGALPALYFTAVVGFVGLARWLAGRAGRPSRAIAAAALAGWLLTAAALSASAYFDRWAESPDVRAAYRSTTIAALAHVAGRDFAGPVVISTVYPGAAHDPSIGRVLLTEASNLRWVDARKALLLPAERPAWLVVPASTPLHPAFAAYAEAADQVTMRPTDLDASFTVYRLAPMEALPAEPLADFDGALELIGARWLQRSVAPGETAELLTIWRVVDPARVGPAVPPALQTEVVLFTHLLDQEGRLLAQHDSLEAPAWDWRAGDIVLQVHPVAVPPETRVGLYDAAVGVYDRQSGARLPVRGAGGAVVATYATGVPLAIHE